ncbi:MFS transporter, partial [bacterium]|nr:MFS transporter [bacterium]
MNAAGRPWLRIFTPFAVGYFLSYLLRNANAVISPDLTQQLSFSPADLGLLTAAYLLAFGLFQLPLGILLDHYG